MQGHSEMEKVIKPEGLGNFVGKCVALVLDNIVSSGDTVSQSSWRESLSSVT